MVSYPTSDWRLVLRYSLNPYCSGRWSRTITVDIKTLTQYGVLILIVVEDGLVLGETIHLTREVES